MYHTMPFSWCPKLSDAVIYHVASFFPKLFFCEIPQCFFVSKAKYCRGIPRVYLSVHTNTEWREIEGGGLAALTCNLTKQSRKRKMFGMSCFTLILTVLVMDLDQYVANHPCTGICATVGVRSLPALLAPGFCQSRFKTVN